MIPIEPVLDRYGVEYNDARYGNQKVNCPFHEDSVASASVNLEKALFNCYGCQVSGDGIALLMQQEGLEFRAAKQLAEELAERADRPLSRSADGGSSLLPRKQGPGRERRGWRSPWARREP